MDQNKSFPYEIIPFTTEENKELQDYFQDFRFEFSRIGSKGYVVSKQYESEASNIYNFPLRSDDIYVVTFPKSGTTWIQELVWLINNNLDYEKAKSILLNKRFRFLEHLVLSPIQEFMPLSVDQIKELPSPRFIKSHLPLSLLPPTLLDKTKVVYVTRDPRDVAVSFHHHKKLMKTCAPESDFKSFWNFFLEGKITFCPYFASVLEAWEKRNHPNMLFLFYEELSENLPAIIRRVVQFFDKQLSDDQVAELGEHLKFDNFKKNKSVNLENLPGLFTNEGGFIRKGKVGNWREHFDEDMTIQAEKWINEHLQAKFNGFIRVGPKGYFLPKDFEKEALNIYNMALRPTDVFVNSYPRSGTTWTQELVWMIVKDLDYETSNAIPLTARYPFLEFSVFMHPAMKQQFQDENKESEHKLKLLENMTKSGRVRVEEAPSPRFVKTHLPLSLLPPSLLYTAKVIYIARDPRDVAVSFYHLHRGIRTQGYIGDFKTYWEFFMKDLHYWTPYFEHLKEAWDLRQNPNLMFLFYEEMCKDLPAAIRSLADFFGKKFSESEINQLCDHLYIDNFKQNKSLNYNVMKELGILNSVAGKDIFIRKGNAGGWRDFFDDEMTAQAEQWMANNLKDTDLRFPHLQ